jgi:predicted lipoprotein with Yx(FWY)xxD motif
MNRFTKYSVAGVTTILLAACGSSSSAKPAATPTTKPATAATTPTTKPVAAVTPTTKPAATTPAAAGPESSVIKVATTSLGKVLVDANGKTLYLYTKDTQNKPGTCATGCSPTWPPLIAAKLPTAGTDVTAKDLTLIRRADGTEQVAYNGWPLYLYAKDAKAGDVVGQKIGGVWFAVDPAGAAIGK